MNHAEAETVFRKIEGLFNNWNPNSEQARHWVARLERIDDFRTANRAADELYDGSTYNSPSPKRFNEILNRFSVGNASGRSRTPAIGTSVLFVVCIEAPSNFPGRLGRVQPLCWPTVEEMPDVNVQRYQAGQLCERMGEMYGGVWQIWDKSTSRTPEAEVHAEARVMREKAGVSSGPPMLGQVGGESKNQIVSRFVSGV